MAIHVNTSLHVGYDTAAKAIAEGRATAHALWALLSDEKQRDGYALRPMPWEGPGEYQHVTYADGPNGYVRIPADKRSLPTDYGRRFAPSRTPPGQLTSDQCAAIKSAIEIAWADDDAPQFDTPEGCEIAKVLAEMFGASIYLSLVE